MRTRMSSTHISSRLSRQIIQFGGFNARIHALNDFLTNNRRVNFYGERWLLFAESPNSKSNFIERNLDCTWTKARGVSTQQ